MEFKEILDKVEELQRSFGIPVETSPTKMFDKGDVDYSIVQERYKLGQTGLKEFYEGNVLMDLDKVYKSLVNQLYTIIGTAHMYGLAHVLEDGLVETLDASRAKKDPDLEKVLSNHLNK
jgi:hypothetical protein